MYVFCEEKDINIKLLYSYLKDWIRKVYMKHEIKVTKMLNIKTCL